jgi:NADPH2:quinone reductase
MRAMIITGFGGPEVFQECQVPKPEPQATEVLVRVHATAVNPVDYKIRREGSWAGVNPPAIIGYDVAGVVEAIGLGVTRFKPGDEVFYTPVIFGGQGSYAEYHVADEAIVALKPNNIGFIEAAGIPLAGCTAWDAVVRLAKIRPAETILIHAGAGGVGSLAIQIAKAAGARVIASCSTANVDLVRSLGADVVVDYRSEDFAAAVMRETKGEGVESVYDTVGNDTLARSLAVIKPHGRMVSIVSTSGDLNGAYLKNITVYFAFMERASHKLESLRTLIEHGQLRPVIDSVLALDQVAVAHQRLEGGGVRGKIILRVVEA